MLRSAGDGRVDFVIVVCTLADNNRIESRHVCRKNRITVFGKIAAARRQQRGKIVGLNCGASAKIAAGGKIYVCAGGNVQAIHCPLNVSARLCDVQRTAGHDLYTVALFGDDLAGQIQLAFRGDLYGGRLQPG